MATNGTQEAFAPSDVLGAVMTMRSGEQESKTKAHEYLERFQKSVRNTRSTYITGPYDADKIWLQKGSWSTIIGILQSKAEPEATLFAAITLRGKVVYIGSSSYCLWTLTSLRSLMILPRKSLRTSFPPSETKSCCSSSISQLVPNPSESSCAYVWPYLPFK